MQGFVIMLQSSTNPARKCFVYNAGGFGIDRGQKAWGRVFDRDAAYVFDTVDEAQAVLKEMVDEIRYQAPEINGRLAARLAEAEIIPV